MIDSGLYSRSTIFSLDEMNINIPQDIKIDDSKIMVSKSIMYHMIHSFIKILFQDKKISKQEKLQSCFDYGYQICHNIIQEQSFGNVRLFVKTKQSDKSDRPFVAEIQLFNLKIWPQIFGSTSKLYSIQKTNRYKLQDIDFKLTKYLSGNNQKVKEYLKLVLQFVKGVLQGFLQKMNLNAQVNLQQYQNKITVDIINVTKKVKVNNF